MKALGKDFFRGMAKNKGKFISVFFIILLGAAFFSGLRSSEGDMLLSAEKYYDGASMMDYRIIGTYGLTDEDIADLNALDEVERAEGVYTADALSDDEDKRAIRLMSLSDQINVPVIVEGRAPASEGECLLDSLLKVYGIYEIGDTVSFVSGTDADLGAQMSVTSFTVVGFADLPQYTDVNRGTGTVGNGELDGFALVLPQVFTSPVYTEAHLLLAGAKQLDSFSEDYDALVQSAEQALETLSETACERRFEQLKEEYPGAAEMGLLSRPSWYVLGRDTIASYVNYQNDAERIASLGKLFPVIFFLVAALVSLTAMTRLVEEERAQIGTLKALGCGNASVFVRYLLYALIPTLFGSVIGVLVGEKVFPLAIVSTYSLLYRGITSYVLPYNFVEGSVAVLASVLVTGAATAFACFHISREKPAQIMRPESPKPGKRVLLERVPFVWKHLSFTQKSTVRNMFRYKKRFLMTVIGVAGCMGLVLVGFGLHDSIMVVADKQFTQISHYDASVTVSGSLSQDGVDALVSDILSQYGQVSAFKMYQKSVDVHSADGTQTVTLCVPQTTEGLEEYFTFRVRTSQKGVEFPRSGAILSEKTAASLGVSAGDTLYIGNDESCSVTVQDVFENYIGHFLFLSAEQYDQLFETPVYGQILLEYEDTSDEFQDELGSYLLGRSEVQSVAFTSTTVDWADDTLSSLNTIVLIVLGAAALLAFVVLYNLNSINIAERKRELATLKVLGFYDTEVASYVYKENILLTLIGVIFGIAVGIFLHQYVIRSIEVDLIMFGRSISLLSYFAGAALTLVFSAIINLAMYGSLKKIDMIESLKSIE